MAQEGGQPLNLLIAFDQTWKIMKKYPNQVFKQKIFEVYQFKLIENFVDPDLNTEYFVTFFPGYVTTLLTDQWHKQVNW